MVEKQSNKLVWFILSALVTILLAAASGWASVQMSTDKELRLDLKAVERRIELVEKAQALQEHQLSIINQKLDLLIQHRFPKN